MMHEYCKFLVSFFIFMDKIFFKNHMDNFYLINIIKTFILKTDKN